MASTSTMTSAVETVPMHPLEPVDAASVPLPPTHILPRDTKQAQHGIGVLDFHANTAPTPQSRHSSSDDDSPPSEADDNDAVALTAVTTTLSAATVPTSRKMLILVTVSWMTLAATFSSTSLLPALPEIAADYGTVVETLTITNAGVLLAMGLASFLWVPLQEAYGRRFAYLAAIMTFTAVSVGIIFAPNLAAFTALRILCGFEASYFMVAGQSYLVDIFDPAYRGTAVGFFQVGTIAGPALGPCFGGIIVTYGSWRFIFVLQAAMAATGLLSAFFCLPRAASAADIAAATITTAAATTTPSSRSRLARLQPRPPKMRIGKRALLLRYNPLRILRFLAYPNIFLTDIACGLLSWTMYSLLTPSRDLIDTRFNLTTPLVSGLFYLAPGAGFICGAIGGGRLSDYVMTRHTARRGGVRQAQDRLNSGLYGFWLVAPAGMLLFGWSLEKQVGGLALPVVAAFLAGIGIMVGFNALNTYTAEVIPGHKSEVMAGKYFIQYVFGAAGSATILLLINRIGVGLAATISVGATGVGGVLVLATARHGSEMQRKVESWTKRRENVEQ
ncbi:hypothetical protein SBRCBS47491_005130 [Sporothrix bragantina]|uniref:Major facilitator superfamily (MFS) profile domain-containing protein n=1 Tax=Sporothrix bragantina TaxID=671064 RepID=A0ABP0BUN2_9PEZI